MRLADRFPDFYKDSQMMMKLFEVHENEINLIQNELVNLLNQFFVETITTSIDRWEEEVGIPKSALPIGQRRENVKSKLRGYGTITASHIKNICDAYTNGEIVVIEDSANYEITVKFTAVRGIPENMEGLKKIIEELKPAHLAVKYEYSYMQWNELDNAEIPWFYLDELNMTWEEFEKWKPTKVQMATFNGEQTFDGTTTFNGME